MARSYSDIREMLRLYLAHDAATVVGKVTTVDKDARTCDVSLDDNVEIYDAMLQCVSDNNTGIVVYPAVGAYVLMLHVEDNDTYQVLSVSDVDSIEVEGGTITINGGDNGGLVNIDPLKTALTNIYNDLQTVATLLAKPVVNGSPVGSFVPSTQLPDDNLSDPQVKH